MLKTVFESLFEGAPHVWGLALGAVLSQIEFHKLNELPEDSNSKLVYVSNNLYFNHENTWLKMGNDELISQNNEQFIYDPNSDYNILNVNTNISIVEISQTLTNDIFIILPNIQKTGIEKTIIMGQSLNNLSNNYSVVLSVEISIVISVS